MDVEAVVADIQNGALEAGAFAFFADEFDVRQELHLDGDRAVPLTGLATPSRNVEGEMSRGVAALLSLPGRCKQTADNVEGLDVSHRVRSRRTANWRLVDHHHLLQPFRAFYPPTGQLAAFLRQFRGIRLLAGE